MNPPHSPGKLFYGWIIVAVGLVSMTFWFGIRASFSVFYMPLLEEFRWNRGESAGVQSVTLLAYTFLAPVVGGSLTATAPVGSLFPGSLFSPLGSF